MGYNIEVSFNIFKNSNVTELEDYIVSTAKNCECDFFYSNCEMEKNLYRQRNHKVININFDDKKMERLLKFLNSIKKIKGIYIESIYNENTNGIIYASQYYLTLMDKNLSNIYKLTRRERSYSEDDTLILKEIDKIKSHV